MSNARHTCDKCQHFTACTTYEDAGDCSLMGDSNNFNYNQYTGKLGLAPDRAYGWDYEGYSAGVYVTPKFGCIHWTKKQPTTTGATA